VAIPNKLRRRREAAAYIREKHGVPCTVNHLAKLAVAGEGPAFRYYNRYPVYEDLDLDAFVESRLSKKMHSTAGLPPRDGAKRRGRPRRELQPA
jgi:hypothetical protein